MTAHDGSERTNVSYLWPTTLRAPSRPPALIYLDMNHWVALSKAQSGHPDGARHLDALAVLLDGASNGAAVFPLSGSIYYEVCKKVSHRQRRELREVMELLSRYAVVTSRSDIATHEVETMLDALLGPSPKPINSEPYLDWGIARALGRVGGFRLQDKEDGRDCTDEVGAIFPGGPAALDALLASAELELNRQILDGPSSAEEEAHLETLGYNRSGHMATAERRKVQEIELVGWFDAHQSWRQGRIRDCVVAHEIMIELDETLNSGLADRGADLACLFPSLEYGRRALDAMPSFDVAVTIKTSYHRDSMHRWTVNDMADIDALGSTLPYCDVVVTDKAIADHANRTGLSERLGTVVTSTLTEAADYLSSFNGSARASGERAEE